MDGAVATKIAERVLEVCMARLAPPERLRGDAAFQRLLGDHATACAGPRGFPLTYEKHIEMLTAEKKKMLPKKGAQFPSHWSQVDLPEPGAKVIDICEVSPRAREYLLNFELMMLKERWEEAVQECPIKPFMDPHFKEKGTRRNWPSGWAVLGCLAEFKCGVPESACSPW